MLKFNKFHISLLALGLTTGVVSTASAIAQDAKARQHGGWYAELEAFHAKAKDSLLTPLPYAESFPFRFVRTPGISVFTQDDRFQTFDSDYKWGYRAAIGYDFPSCNCSNYGFSLEYTYHKSDDDRHLRDIVGFNSDNGPLAFPALDEFYGFFDVDATDADANYEFKYHAVDLLGHRNMTLCGVDLQFFTGARYVRLKQDLNRHFFIPDERIPELFPFLDLEDLSTTYHSKFDGVGPRAGFNAFYQVCNGFGLVTEVAGNLLFGTTDDLNSEVNVELFRNEDGTVSSIDAETHQTRHNNDALTVPGLSGKVAIAYRTLFSNCSSLSIEVGYRGEKYFGIGYHSSLALLAEDNDPGFVKGGNYHDYDISGPYINIAFHA